MMPRHTKARTMRNAPTIEKSAGVLSPGVDFNLGLWQTLGLNFEVGGTHATEETKGIVKGGGQDGTHPAKGGKSIFVT